MSANQDAERLVEAILLTASAPVSEAELKAVLPGRCDVSSMMAKLVADYEGRGFGPFRVAGGWAFRTVPDRSGLAAVTAGKPPRLTRASLETLAVIALFQPVTRPEMERVRGVGVAKGTLDLLLWAGLIRPGPRRDGPGRPLTWMTTNAFLDRFDLEDAGAIPGIEDMRAKGLLDLVGSLTRDADAAGAVAEVLLGEEPEEAVEVEGGGREFREPPSGVDGGGQVGESSPLAGDDGSAAAEDPADDDCPPAVGVADDASEDGSPPPHGETVERQNERTALPLLDFLRGIQRSGTS